MFTCITGVPKFSGSVSGVWSKLCQGGERKEMYEREEGREREGERD